MTSANVTDAATLPVRRPGKRTGRRAAAGGIPGLREALSIWVALGALPLAVLITYARFPVSQFYHVSIDGLTGELSRALVLLNFPIAFIAIALLGVAVARLYAIPGALTATGRWLVGISASIAMGLSLVAAFVVRQSDLDAKPANVIPAIGALLALGLPWILADLGVFVGDNPLLGNLYMSKEVLPGHTLPAVHLGHHHGFDGLIFAVAAILLSRQLGRVRGVPRWPLTIYLALMFVYGLANMVQDFWGEQIVKRGWTDVGVPTVAEPKLTPAWGPIVLATVLVAAILLIMNRPGDEDQMQPLAS